MGRPVLGAEVIDEEDALEMVVLVLGSTGEESFGLEIDRVAVEILAEDPDAGMALHVILQAGHAEASLDVDFTLLPDGVDLRIDHDQRHHGLKFREG